MRRAAVVLALAAAAGAQGPTTLVVDAGRPVVGRVLADLDGDALEDVILEERGGGLSVFLQDPAGEAFRGPVRVALPPGTGAFAVADLLPAAGGELVLLRAGGLSVHAVGAEGLGPPERRTAVELVFPPAFSGRPSFIGWGADVDGDGRADLVVPGLACDYLVRGAGGPLVPLRTPGTVRRAPFADGLAGLRRRRPRVAFHRVRRGVADPVYFDDGGLHRLVGDEKRGFGPGRATVFRLEPRGGDPLDVLERVAVNLADVDGEGRDDLLLVRTRMDQDSRTLAQRTRLLFHLDRERGDGRPDQVILLPGVLSSGPSLVDVDADGHRDLFLSLYGGDLSANLARLVLRSVSLDYLVYRGTGGSPPFARAPALELDDGVPLAQFDRWGLRHRLQLADDWTGDGRPDLVRIRPRDDPEGVVVAVHPITAEGGRIETASEPAVRVRVPGTFTGYGAARLAPGRPAVTLEHDTGTVFVAR